MKDELLKKLRNAILEYDADEAGKLAARSIEEEIDPIETLEVLTVTIKEVGDQFGRGDLFLPELIAAAEAMSRATEPLEVEIRNQGKKKKSQGTVVIGTVYGDIHDIGKNMVATLLKAAGFNVVDCGVNVQVDKFLDFIVREEADILALSALLTTTAPEQKKIIKSLSEKGMRDKVKVIVGGGGITKQFADSIGADGYDATATGAAALAKSLLSLE
jgi:trimethylamine corrinoid protein